MNPWEQLAQRLGAAGVRPAARADGAESTEDRFDAEVARRRDALRAAGVRPGDAVAVTAEAESGCIARLVAAAAERAVVLPLPARSPSEADGAAAHFGAMVDPQGARRATGGEPHPLVARLIGRCHAGLLIRSSGTTAQPKLVLHDFDALLEGHLARPGRPHVVVATLPLHHIGGIDVLLGVLASGGRLVRPAQLSPDEVGRVIERERATVLPASPTMLNLMLAAGAFGRFDCSSLRTVAYGAEPMPPTLLERLRAALPGAKLAQRFGTSETGALRTVDSERPLHFRIQDSDTEWRIVDGELWLRSPRTMLGYLSGPEGRLTDDGWFRTGDLAEAAPDGSLRIAGRAIEVINVGGEKVLPAEVEDLLLTVPGLRACRVRGEPHPLTGAVVAADTEWADAPDAIEAKRRIRAALAGRAPAWKLPVKVRVVPSIGMTDRGKKA